MVMEAAMPHIVGARSFSELADFAVELCRKNGHTQIVCGPITSGGLGNIRDNFEAFAASVWKMSDYLNTAYMPTQPLLNQLDFEPELWALLKRWRKDNPSSEGNPILEEFYEVIFSQVEFTLAHFLPGSDTSFGAQWERARFLRQQRLVRDIHPGWVEIALRDWRARPDSAQYLDSLLAHAPEAYASKEAAE